jgi:hypothetical protein
VVKRVAQVALVLVLMAGGVWLWRTLFPSDEAQIQRVLLGLASAASMDGGEGNISRIRRVDRVTDRLTPDVVIRFAPEGRRGVVFNGRDEVLGAAVAAGRTGRSVVVEFVDIDVSPVPSGAESATAVLTAKVQVVGERDFGVQALRVELSKEKSFGWRLKRLESFNPLSKE